VSRTRSGTWVYGVVALLHGEASHNYSIAGLGKMASRIRFCVHGVGPVSVSRLIFPLAYLLRCTCPSEMLAGRVDVWPHVYDTMESAREVELRIRPLRKVLTCSPQPPNSLHPYAPAAPQVGPTQRRVLYPPTRLRAARQWSELKLARYGRFAGCRHAETGSAGGQHLTTATTATTANATGRSIPAPTPWRSCNWASQAHPA
jgi:hypothetical protein